MYGNRYRKHFYRLSCIMCAVFAVSVISGCVTSQDTRRLQYEINQLKSDVSAIKKTSRTIESGMPGRKQLESRLQELEDAQDATAKTVSDLLINVQDLTTEFQVLTGRFEEARYFSEKSSTELLQSKDMLVAKTQELESAVEQLQKDIQTVKAARTPVPQKTAAAADESAAPAETETTGTAEKADETGTDGDGSEVKDVYMAAYQAFKDGRMQEAREQFKSVIENYPVNDYTDNARFWTGESYYREENYEDAILAYEELFRNHPDSNKYPDAMLKQGLAFYAMNDKKTGRILLERLIDKYPESEQAKLAKRKLRIIAPPEKN